MAGRGVKSVMRRTSLLTLLVLILALAAACGNGASSGSRGGSTTPSLPPGTVTGTVVGYRSAHRDQTTPEPNVAVAAYTRAFPYIGPVTADRPHPVARAVTDTNGHFEIDGLTPGHRYFLLFGAATAKWVTLGQQHGATVTAALCQDCPLPM
jgi:hypothetical protein